MLIDIFVIALGLCVGSFLTVCIYRIPYGRPMGPPNWDEDEAEQDVTPPPAEQEKKLSIWEPSRSFCPHCNKQLKALFLVPFFSWVFLGGKCGFCRAPIPFRYPLTELLTAAAFWLSWHFFGPTPTAVLSAVLCCSLIVISFIDIDYYIIPDVISKPGMVIGLLLAAANQFFHWFSAPFVGTFLWSLAGFAFGGGILLLISEVYLRLRRRIGLGFGDVKLLAMIGAFLGIEGAFYSMFLGSLFGAVFGITLMLVYRKNSAYQLPFGPYLAVGAVLYLFGVHSALPFFPAF